MQVIQPPRIPLLLIIQKFLDKNGLKDKRIGIEKPHLEGTSRVTALLSRQWRDMKKLGATIVEVEIRKSLQDAFNAEIYSIEI
jgi:amidase